MPHDERSCQLFPHRYRLSTPRCVQEPSSTSTSPPSPQQPQQPAEQQAFAQQPPQQRLELNVWAYKPPWCQPWSILVTGAAVVAGAWAVSGRSPVWAALAALPIAAWWYFFLLVMPAQFRAYAEQSNAELAAQQQQQQRRGQQL